MRYLIRLEEVAEARHQVVLGAMATLLSRSGSVEEQALLQAFEQLDLTAREAHIGQGNAVLPVPAQLSPPIKFATDWREPTA